MGSCNFNFFILSNVFLFFYIYFCDDIISGIYVWKFVPIGMNVE